MQVRSFTNRHDVIDLDRHLINERLVGAVRLDLAEWVRRQLQFPELSPCVVVPASARAQSLSVVLPPTGPLMLWAT